jgi:hypothetical protein
MNVLNVLIRTALKYALATIRYRELPLIDMPGPLDQSQLPVCLLHFFPSLLPLTNPKLISLSNLSHSTVTTRSKADSSLCNSP